MTFDFEWSKFEADSKWSIKIDGHLSDAEKQELHEAFQAGVDLIHDSTSWELKNFLMQDLLPHIDTISPEIKGQALLLLAKHNVETSNTLAEVPPALLEKFHIEDLAALQELQRNLGEFWIEWGVTQMLTQYNQYIEKNLWALSPDIREKIYRSIGIRMWNLWTLVDEVKTTQQENPENGLLTNYRWIVNSKIEGELWEINNKILPSAQLLNTWMTDPQRVYDAESAIFTFDEFGETQDAGQQRQAMSYKISEIEDMFATELDSDGQFDEWGAESLNQNATLQIDREEDADIFAAAGGKQEELEGISLLSEADKKLEAETMLYYLCAVGVQCLPYVWAVTGAAADATDIVSSTDSTLDGLKAMWLVPPEYMMEKTALDNILAWAGIILSVVWFQALAKTKKLATAKNGIKHLNWAMIEKVFESFSAKMWLSDELKDTLKGFFGIGNEQNTLEVANSNIIPWETEFPEIRNIWFTESTPMSRNTWIWVPANDTSIPQDLNIQRTIRHSQSEYLWVGGKANEYGFVDTHGQLHINTEMFESLPAVQRTQKMREFVAHERAHQAILNLPEGKLQEIHQSFIRHNVFVVTQSPSEFGLHFERTTSPLDTTNEILAHMIGRLRIWENVPDTFIEALKTAGIIKTSSVNNADILSDINTVFWVNASRAWWQELGWVRNTDNLAEAAMTAAGEVQNLFWFQKYLLRNLSSNPDTLRLIDSFHENWPDIWEIVSKIDFGNKDVKNALNLIRGEFNELLTQAQITKISRYLENHGKKLPSWLNMKELKESWDTGVPDEFFDGLMQVFGEINAWQKSDNIPPLQDSVTVKSDIGEEVISLDSKMSESLQSLFDEWTDINKVLQKIDVTSKDSWDNFEQALSNIHGFVSEERFSEIAEALWKTPDAIKADLDFVNWEAGGTYNFLKTIFRTLEQKATGIKYTENPFEMPLLHLARRAKTHFWWEEGKDIATYIQSAPRLQKAVQSLDKANYHNPDFVKYSLWEIWDFYDRFWEEATAKLIREIFWKQDTDFSKLFANIKRYDEAIQIAETKKSERLWVILKAVWADPINNTMKVRVWNLERYIASEWYIKGNFETLAHDIGNELWFSGLYLELGREKFVNLLFSLGVEIPQGKRDDFFDTIESLSSFRIAKSISDAEIWKINMAREKLPSVISWNKWKSISRSDFLDGLWSESPKAKAFFQERETWWIGTEKDILILNGDTVSKIPRSSMNQDILWLLSAWKIEEIKNHGLDQNSLNVTMIYFMQKTNA